MGRGSTSLRGNAYIFTRMDGGEDTDGRKQSYG